MNPKVVLVPLDGSTLAESAMGPAIGFGRAGAKLVLIRAVETQDARAQWACDACPRRSSFSADSYLVLKWFYKIRQKGLPQYDLDPLIRAVSSS